MPNPVAPGPSGQNLLTLPGRSAVIHGNFDRKAETEESASSPRSVDPLLSLLEDSDPALRVGAAATLGRLGIQTRIQRCEPQRRHRSRA
jgi:hypothetical protein